MNRYQLNIIEMATTTSVYMAKNKTLWQGNKAITATMAEVDADLTALSGMDVQQKTPVTGQAVDKATIRYHCEEQILVIANQLAALAAKNDNAVLEAQTDLTFTDLDIQAADDLEATATRIANLATTNLTALADYNITQADLTKLTTLMTTFHAAKSAPRAAVVDRKKQTDTIAPLVKDMMSTLNRQLDRQVTAFKTSNPDFYAGYQSARVIVDRGHPAKAKTPPAPATPKPPTP